VALDLFDQTGAVDTSKIAVVGAGTMGAGIAQVALEAGYPVTLIDSTQEAVDRGQQTIQGFLERKVTKETLTGQERDEMLARLATSTDMEQGVAGADMVVEAVFEDLALKQDVFSRLDACSPPGVILASNTSTLPISKIASVTTNSERVIGTHYFSPVPLMRLVEVVRGQDTSDEVAERTVALCESFGKSPILIGDVPGFIVNRFLCLLYNEAANLIHSGVATAEDIDSALKLGCNWPMGVAEIMDLAGVDITLQALTAMHEMTGEQRYEPSPLLKQMVANNHLGRKTGQGFYEHS
jgi:3-hydroxybutyryl-CoA dehydrogenase